MHKSKTHRLFFSRGSPSIIGSIFHDMLIGRSGGAVPLGTNFQILHWTGSFIIWGHVKHRCSQSPPKKNENKKRSCLVAQDGGISCSMKLIYDQSQSVHQTRCWFTWCKHSDICLRLYLYMYSVYIYRSLYTMLGYVGFCRKPPLLNNQTTEGRLSIRLLPRIVLATGAVDQPICPRLMFRSTNLSC